MRCSPLLPQKQRTRPLLVRYVQQLAQEQQARPALVMYSTTDVGAARTARRCRHALHDQRLTQRTQLVLERCTPQLGLEQRAWPALVRRIPHLSYDLAEDLARTTRPLGMP